VLYWSDSRYTKCTWRPYYNYQHVMLQLELDTSRI
jgi:hypothetical protein